MDKKFTDFKIFTIIGDIGMASLHTFVTIIITVVQPDRPGPKRLLKKCSLQNSGCCKVFVVFLCIDH